MLRKYRVVPLNPLRPEYRAGHRFIVICGVGAPDENVSYFPSRKLADEFRDALNEIGRTK